MRNKMKELPAYGLVVSEGGPKFRESEPDAPHNIAAAKGRLNVEKVSMPNVARVLSLSLDRPVLDRTGLTGRYTFRLEWDPEDDPAAASSMPPANFNYRALANAMQDQLGLRLELQQGLQ
jgi:uncharacterized protein (TIGR03435 family)